MLRSGGFFRGQERPTGREEHRRETDILQSLVSVRQQPHLVQVTAKHLCLLVLKLAVRLEVFKRAARTNLLDGISSVWCGREHVVLLGLSGCSYLLGCSGVECIEPCFVFVERFRTLEVIDNVGIRSVELRAVRYERIQQWLNP